MAISSGEIASCQNFHSSESISAQLACNLISCVSSQGVSAAVGFICTYMVCS